MGRDCQPPLFTLEKEIIIPRYSRESRSFQRATDWLFGSQEGYERYMREKMKKAEAEAKAIAENEKSEERGWMNGLGQVKANISVTDYMYWELLYPGCWRDKTFQSEYLRDNPYARPNKPQQKTFVVGGITA